MVKRRGEKEHMLARPAHYSGDGGGIRRVAGPKGAKSGPKVSFYACVSKPLRERGTAGAVTDDFLMASELTNNVSGGFMKKYDTEQEAVQHLLDRAQWATRNHIEFHHRGAEARLGGQQARPPRGTDVERGTGPRGDGGGNGDGMGAESPLREVPSVVEEIDDDPGNYEEAKAPDGGLAPGRMQERVGSPRNDRRKPTARGSREAGDGGETRQKRRRSPARQGELGRFERLLRLVAEHFAALETGGPSPLVIGRMDEETLSLVGELRARLGHGQRTQSRAVERTGPSTGAFGRLLLN